MWIYFLKVGWHNISKTPWLSVLIVVILGLGVGVFSSLFSLYAAISYVPMEGKREQLFSVQLASYGDGLESWGRDDGLPDQVTYPDVSNLQESQIPTRQTPFYKILYVVNTVDESQSPTLDFVGGVVSHDFFSMFGLEFIYGSAWSQQDEFERKKLIIIDEEMNQWAFNGANSVGKTIFINKKIFTVAGVIKTFMPQPYFFQADRAFGNNFPQYFAPFTVTQENQWHPYGNVSGWRAENINHYDDFLKTEYVWLNYWVELNELEQQHAYSEYLQNYSLAQNALGRFDNPNPRGSIRAIGEWLAYIDVIDDENIVMLALAGLFLLACLFNCSGIILSRSDKHIENIAIRRALGATPWNTVQQLCIEAGILGVFAGVTSILFTHLGLGAIREWYPSYKDIAYLPVTIMLLSILLAVCVGILAALYPALRCAKQPVSVFLKSQ